MPDPVETPKELVREAARGRSERTPWIALGAVHLVVAAFVAVIIGIVLLVYFLA
jgi:hypothetical protein